MFDNKELPLIYKAILCSVFVFVQQNKKNAKMNTSTFRKRAPKQKIGQQKKKKMD